MLRETLCLISFRCCIFIVFERKTLRFQIISFWLPQSLPATQFSKEKGIAFFNHSSYENTTNSWKNFDDYNINSGNPMEDPQTIQSECTTSTSDLCFACPCGKEYKSYPALFTHIKNKHNGRAPGNIKKPSLPSKRRGRPPTNKHPKCQTHPSLAKPETDSSQFMTLQSICQIERQVTSATCIEAIARTMLSLPSQMLNKARLNEMVAFIQMNVFLARHQSSDFTLHIGSVLKEFLQELSSSVCWSHFEQVYSLLMLLVQFVMDQQNNGDIIINGPIDLLCDHINPFLQNGVLEMVAELQIGEMSIFKAESMLDIFDAFFQWIMVKRYTNYRIRLNGNSNKPEPACQ